VFKLQTALREQLLTLEYSVFTRYNLCLMYVTDITCSTMSFLCDMLYHKVLYSCVCGSLYILDCLELYEQVLPTRVLSVSIT